MVTYRSKEEAPEHRRSCPYRTMGQLPQLLRGTKPPSPFFPAIRDRAVPRLGGGCTQAACFFSISSAAGSTSTASCCFPLRVLVGFCKSSALTASRACVCGILQVRSTVNCSRHHHARLLDSVAKTSLLFVAH